MADVLDTIYSDAYNAGDYYMWEDGNPEQEDRSGFFVTTCVKEGTICIKKCFEQPGCNDDLFGVTVESAAFVGGQEYITSEDGIKIGRDYRYSLVVPTGVVSVRCEDGVKAGDYVSMNVDGVAKTVYESFGYKVIEIKQIGDVTFATIILSTQGDKLSDIYTRMVDTNQRIDTCIDNMVVVANVATEASNIAHELKEELAEMDNRVGNVSGTLEGIQGDINDLQAGSATNESVKQLRAEVEASINAASARTEEVSKIANHAFGDASTLVKKFEPLIEWENGDETGAQYLVRYMNDGIATKADIETVSNDAKNALTAIQQNALSIESLASSISIYSVGAFSQANGFSLYDAINAMEVDTVYVPTVNHSESYVRDQVVVINGQENASEHIDGGSLENIGARSVLNASPVLAYNSKDYVYERIDDDTYCPYYTMNFIIGNHYVWKGNHWEEHPNTVWFLEEYVTGDERQKYWYTCDASVTNPKTGVVYAPETLYEWRDGQWIAVATSKQNATSKMISLVRQTADAFSVELVNARGSTASLDVRLDDDEARIETLTKWQGATNESIASISQTASENQASIEMVVGLKETDEGTERVIKAASIIAAVNKDESNVTIDADKINFYGVAQFNANGTTTINGSYITTGTIQGPQGTKGSHWDLATGKLVIKNDDSGTVIDGGCITTGTIDASKVKVTNLDASNITTGMIQSPNGDSYWNLATGELVISGYATTDDIPSLEGLLDENTFNMYKDAIENGTTTINGGCITTGIIDAKYLNLSGCLTVGDLDGYATTSDLSTYQDAIQNGKTTIHGGCITTGVIAADCLDLTGCLTVNDVGENGTTQIYGGRIMTGTLSVDTITTSPNNTDGVTFDKQILVPNGIFFGDDTPSWYTSESRIYADNDYWVCPGANLLQIRANEILNLQGAADPITGRAGVAMYLGSVDPSSSGLDNYLWYNSPLYCMTGGGYLNGGWSYNGSRIATLSDLEDIEARLAALEAGGGYNNGGNTGGDETVTCEHKSCSKQALVYPTCDSDGVDQYTCNKCDAQWTKPSPGGCYDEDDDGICDRCFKPIKPTTCLLEGTPIMMADGTTKAIEDIQPGDLLQSYNPITKEQTTAVAIESYATGENTDFDVYHFSNGNSAHIYIKHGFYNARTGCVQNLKEITDEDMLLDINGEVVTCARIDTEHFDVPKKRYNLITSNNLYYADNVLLGHSPWFKYKLIQKRNYTIPDDILKLFKRDLLAYRQFHKYEEQFELEKRSDVEELINCKAAYFAECFKRDNDAFERIKDYYTNQSDET